MRQKQDNTKDVREEQEHLSDFMGDIGNFDLPDLDLNLVDFLPSDETEETRYTLPKVVPMKEDFVMYDISTLSLSQNNVDSLHTLMDKGYIEELNLIISVYFWGNERRSLVPYIYKQLDIGDRFQLAVAGVHTKTVHFETLGGRKIIMHGSANLRSSGNIEQFTMEENPELYDFYDDHFNRIIDKYATIRKPIRNSKAWDLFTRMTFNDKS